MLIGQNHCLENWFPGTSLVDQWLRLHAATIKGVGSIPDQGTKSWVVQ